MQGVLKPFCDLLAAKDDKTVCVVMDGITNILATAEKLGEVDKVAMMVEECGGLDRVEALQSHENEAIYHKALTIIENFFPGDDQVEYCLILLILMECSRLMTRLPPRLETLGLSSPLRRISPLKPDLIFRNFLLNICLGNIQ